MARRVRDVLQHEGGSQWIHECAGSGGGAPLWEPSGTASISLFLPYFQAHKWHSRSLISLATDPWSAVAQALAVTTTNTLSSSRNNLRSTIPSSHHSHMSSPRSPHAAFFFAAGFAVAFTLPLPTGKLFCTALSPPSAFTSLPLLTTPTAAARSVSSTSSSAVLTWYLPSCGGEGGGCSS
jgi:hypothetical protein